MAFVGEEIKKQLAHANWLGVWELYAHDWSNYVIIF